MNDGAKKKIFQELYEEIHEAWPIPDTRVLIREWPNEAVSQDGRIENVPMRGKTGMPGSDRVEERPPKP
jgi:hypothetical protein